MRERERETLSLLRLLRLLLLKELKVGPPTSPTPFPLLHLGALHKGEETRKTDIAATVEEGREEMKHRRQRKTDEKKGERKEGMRTTTTAAVDLYLLPDMFHLLPFPTKCRM